jgi:hypothetical protein
MNPNLNSSNPTGVARRISMGLLALSGLFAACTDSLNQADVISMNQFSQNPGVLQKMLADCSAKEPKETEAALKFMATKFGQSCSNAQSAQRLIDYNQKIQKAEQAMRERDDRMIQEMRNSVKK